MARRKRPKDKEPPRLSDFQIAERLQSILINAAEGRRSVSDDEQYPGLRRKMLVIPVPVPPLVTTHPTVDSYVAHIKGIDDRLVRVEKVRDQFRHVLDWSRPTADAPDSSTWTGQEDRVARLKTLQTLMPLARAGVESMIATLSEPNPNGAPLLEEREEALKHLRELHRTLGELLGAIEGGHFEDDLGQGLAAEAARYAKRAARALRDDPMPYLSGALLLGIFSACGFPGIGGFLGGVAANVQRHGEKRH